MIVAPLPPASIGTSSTTQVPELAATPVSIDSLLSCPLCFNRYTLSNFVPKLLPCHHSFCVVCLENLADQNDQCACPTCQKPFERPESGHINDMQTNFYIAAILDSQNAIAQQQRQHQQAPSVKIPSEENVPKVSATLCRSHGKPVTFFCSTCSIFICNQCIIEHNKANNHSIEDVDHFVEHCKTTLADRAAVARSAQEARQQYIKTLRSELEGLASKEKDLQNNTDQIFREMSEKLIDMKKKIDEEAVASSTRISCRLNAEITRMQQEAEQLENVRRLCEETRENSDSDLKSLSAVYQSQEIADIVSTLSNPIHTVPRATLAINRAALDGVLDSIHNFVEGNQTTGCFNCSEVKRPVIVLPRPTNITLESEEPRDTQLSPIAESSSHVNGNFIEIDNVAVKLRDKPARHQNNHQEEVVKHRSQLYVNQSSEHISSSNAVEEKSSRHRRSLIELRPKHGHQQQQSAEKSPSFLIHNTIASNSSSGASSASDGMAKMSPPVAQDTKTNSVANSKGKTPFVFEFDDTDSVNGSDIEVDRVHNSSSGSSNGRRQRSAAQGMPVLTPPKNQTIQPAKEKLTKSKFSFGRALSELFGKDKRSSVVVEVGRRGEEKVTIRPVQLGTNNSSNTGTSLDSGGDHHSMASANDARLLTPGQMRCVSLESVALPPSNSNSCKNKSQSPPINPPAHANSPQRVRVGTRVSDVVAPISENRRFSGDFSKRFNMKSKMTGGEKTRSFYAMPRREESIPVVFPAKNVKSSAVTSKPPAFQASSSASSQHSSSRTTQPSHPEPQSQEIVSALIATASSSNIQFSNPSNQPAALSRSNKIVANWNTSSFCQAPVLKFGKQGTGPGCFDWPESIVLSPSGSEVYVGDFKNHRVEAFSSSGEYLYEFSVRDGMIDYYPGHMALDPRGDRIVFPWLEKEGNGYIANSLVAFTRDGRYLMKYNHRDFGCPRSVAINSRSEIFVADQQKGCIFVFDRDGRRLRTIGKRGTGGPGEFNHPCHVAIGQNNEVIVADQNNNRIQVFDTRGGICEVISHRFTRPCYCAVDNYGSLMVADGSNKISILSFNSAVPSRSPVVGVVESVEDRLRGPRGLAVDSSGSLYVCDVGNFCVKKFDYSDLLPQRL